jgi:ribosomal protein S18 acetylase RimI-like enzyme
MTPPPIFGLGKWGEAGRWVSLFHLSQLPASLLPALAALHKATMPTLLSDLGDNFVLRYYHLAQTDSSVIALCALETSQPSPQSPITNHQSPIAYALGSPDPAALNAQLRQPLTWFAVQMLKLAFSRPGVLLQLAQSVLTASEANSLKPGQIELTYIGVAPEARGQGLGKSILAAFVESARAAGYTSVALSVETDNPAALALYTKFGFTITQTFREGRYHRHRMEYQI